MRTYLVNTVCVYVEQKGDGESKKPTADVFSSVVMIANSELMSLKGSFYG